MKLHGFLAVMAACFALGGAVLAQEVAPTLPPPMPMPTAPIRVPSETEMVGVSDLIIIGTVKQITPKAADASGNNSRAVIAVEQTIKGESPESIEVNYITRIKGRGFYNPYMVNLKEGQRSLFVLQRSQPGWALQEGPVGVKAADQLDKFAQIAKEFPVQVTINNPVRPMYFGHPTLVSVTVKNNGKEALSVPPPSLEGFFYSARMGAYLPVQSKQEFFFGGNGKIPTDDVINNNLIIDGVRAVGQAVMPAQPQNQTIEPGASYTFTLEAGCLLPESWKVFTPETFLQAPVAIHARVYCEKKAAEGEVNYYSVTSPWVTTMTGFHPPLEDGTVPKPNTNFDPNMAEPGSVGGGENPGGGGPIVNPDIPVDAVPGIPIPFDGPVIILPAIPLNPDFDPGMGKVGPAIPDDGLLHETWGKRL